MICGADAAKRAGITATILGVLLFWPSHDASAQSESVAPRAINATEFGTLTAYIGKTPEDVYAAFGRPFDSHVEGHCCRIGAYAGDILVHVYNADGGGVIAFLYGKYIQGILVNGVVFDNLNAVQFLSLSQFFPDGTQRIGRLAACLSSDPYHQIPGDTGLGQISEKVLWAAPRGRVLYARYRTDGKARAVYDPVSGRDVPKPLDDVDSLRLLQWGYFAGTVNISDLHFGMHHGQNTDYTIGSWSGTSCAN